MGLPRRIALTGGLTIGAIIAVAYLASKTDILQKFAGGLSSIGKYVGLGVGEGVANIPRGVTQGFANVFGEAGKEDPLGLKKAYNDWLNSMGIATPAGITGGVIPSAYAEPQIAGSSGAAGGQAMVDPLITPAVREYEDYLKRTGINTPSYTSKSGLTTIPSYKTGVVSAKPITIGGINTVDIKTTSGSFSKSLTQRLAEAKQATLNYNKSASKAVTGGARPANTSSNKTLTKAKGKPRR